MGFVAWTTIWDRNFPHSSVGAESISIVSCICSCGRLNCWVFIWWRWIGAVWVYMHCGSGKLQEEGLQEEWDHRMFHSSCRGMPLSLCPSVNKSKETVNHTAGQRTVLLVYGMFRLLAVLEAQHQCPIDWAEHGGQNMEFLQATAHKVLLYASLNGAASDVQRAVGGGGLTAVTSHHPEKPWWKTSNRMQVLKWESAVTQENVL